MRQGVGLGSSPHLRRDRGYLVDGLGGKLKINLWTRGGGPRVTRPYMVIITICPYLVILTICPYLVIDQSRAVGSDIHFKQQQRRGGCLGHVFGFEKLFLLPEKVGLGLGQDAVPDEATY